MKILPSLPGRGWVKTIGVPIRREMTIVTNKIKGENSTRAIAAKRRSHTDLTNRLILLTIANPLNSAICELHFTKCTLEIFIIDKTNTSKNARQQQLIIEALTAAELRLQHTYFFQIQECMETNKETSCSVTA